MSNELTRETDRPALEPTPAMVEAGVAAYYRTDKRFNSDEEIVRKIYQAMLGAH